jgi:hypothetical protein
MDTINEFNTYKLKDIITQRLVDNLTEQALKVISADLRARITELVLSMKPQIQSMVDDHAQQFILNVLFSDSKGNGTNG